MGPIARSVVDGGDGPGWPGAVVLGLAPGRIG